MPGRGNSIQIREKPVRERQLSGGHSLHRTRASQEPVHPFTWKFPMCVRYAGVLLPCPWPFGLICTHVRLRPHCGTPCSGRSWPQASSFRPDVADTRCTECSGKSTSNIHSTGLSMVLACRIFRPIAPPWRLALSLVDLSLWRNHRCYAQKVQSDVCLCTLAIRTSVPFSAASSDKRGCEAAHPVHGGTR